ncbi:MAG: hypothetical protein ACRERU_11690 [Methylococcales bacterium]
MKNRRTILLYLMTCLVILSSCGTSVPPGPQGPPPPKPSGDPLVIKGRQLFFNETFNGNGRTCGTCHRAENNLTVDPEFIATLPPNDPLFVAETVPALRKNFENPTLMRKFGLIMENQDGFGDLANKFNMRGIPHVFAQRVSIDSSNGPHTGWSGDGAPDDHSLRSFATGAVVQHFTKTTKRREGVDFRRPTKEELDALEAFQLTLGRQQDLSLPLALNDVVAKRGQELFNNEGRCSNCHFNAGANVPPTNPARQGNLNFNTGVENLPDQPADLTGELNPPDDGEGTPGNGNFNTPSLVESADTGPFFHNNSVETIEAAVAFYNGDAFANSPSGQFIARGPLGRIHLDATQITAVGAFLRVINALDNIREVSAMLNAVAKNEYLSGEHPKDLVNRVIYDIEDAIDVLSGAGLHPGAVKNLKSAYSDMEKAATQPASRISLATQALSRLNAAKKQMVD